MDNKQTKRVELWDFFLVRISYSKSNRLKNR